MTQIRNLKTGIKYKDTPIGKIPVNWEVQRLGDLCISQPEYGANVSAIDKDNNLPRYIRITDVSEDGRLFTSTWKSIKKEVAQPYMLQEGDFLFARSGATVGKAYLYKKKDGECAFAGYMIRFKPNPHQLLPEFLFQYAHSNYYYNWVKGILRSGAQPNINAQEYSDMLIPNPPLGEQKRIAEILITVDQAIEKTAQIIEKTKEAKKGLMKRLLTRGIGHKKSKKTEIGEIPEGWKGGRLSDIAYIIMGQSPPGSTYNTKGVGCPILNGPTKFTNYYPIPIQFTARTTKVCKAHDILFCVRGSSTGRMNIADKEYCIGRGLAAIRERSIGNTKYIYYMLISLTPKIFREASGAGSTFQTISGKALEEIKIVIPPLKEQKQIAEILSSIDAEIEKESSHKEQLESLKKGLMQVLLTGKIRVKV